MIGPLDMEYFFDMPQMPAIIAKQTAHTLITPNLLYSPGENVLHGAMRGAWSCRCSQPRLAVVQRTSEYSICFFSFSLARIFAGHARDSMARNLNGTPHWSARSEHENNHFTMQDVIG